MNQLIIKILVANLPTLLSFQPAQQNYITQLNLSEIQQYFVLSVETCYSPLQTYNFSLETTNISTQQEHIFSIINNGIQVFNYYVQFEPLQLNIYHKIQFTSVIQDKLIYTEKSISFDPYNYEGKTISLQLNCNIVFNITTITISYVNEVFTNSIYNSQGQILISENTKIISGPIVQDLIPQLKEFSLFNGFVEIKVQTKNVANYVSQYRVINNCYYNPKFLIGEMISFDQESKQITLREKNYESYAFTGWIKLNFSNTEFEVQILKVSATQLINENIVSKLFVLSYNINQFQQLVKLEFLNYTFPFLSQSHVNQIKKEYQVEQFLQNWHYIQLGLRQDNVLFLQLESFENSYYFLNVTITNVYQFSNLLFSIILMNQNDNNQQFSAQLNNFEFFPKICFIDLESTKCHYSCLTCFGPYKNQCLTCSSEKRYLKNNQCYCQSIYIDFENQDCYNIFPQMNQILIPLSNKEEYDQDEGEVVCSFGYFQYNGNCYKCPKINLYYQCKECLLNPNTWIYYPFCTKSYKQHQDNNNYTYKDFIYFVIMETLDYYIYYFQDDELKLCDYCLNYCFTPPYDFQCYLSSYYHLGEQLRVRCQNKYDSNLGLCVPESSLPIVKINNNNCSYNDQNRCFSCYDYEKQFIAIDESSCLECEIENCQYCFQFNQFDRQLNSILKKLNFIKWDEDIIIGCAKCKFGYHYNFGTSQCEKNIIQIQCQDYYIEFNQLIKCITVNQDNYQYIENCQQIIFNCQTCINYSGNFFCIQCIFGYYYNAYYETCYPCQSVNVDFIQCTVHQHQNQYQSIQAKLLTFIVIFANQSPRLFSLQSIDSNYLIPLQCNDNQILSQYSCYNVIDQCKLQDQTSCLECTISNDGTNRYTQNIEGCITCQQYCEYCQSQISTLQSTFLFQRLNTKQKFNETQLSNKSRCLQIEKNNKTLFIDNSIGDVRQCSEQTKKCQIKYEITIESDQSIMQFEMPKIFETNSVNFVSFIFNAQNLTFLISKFDINNQNYQVIPSIKKTSIQFLGNPQATTILLNQEYNNYDELSLTNIQLYFWIYYNASLIISHEQYLDVYFNNIVISDTFDKPSDIYKYYDLNTSTEAEFSNLRPYKIQITNPNFIKLENIIIKDINLIETSLFNFINNNDLNQSIILITNFTVINCTFTNSLLFDLRNKIQTLNVSIQQLKIINCKFINGGIIQFYQNNYETQITLNQLQIIGSQFFSSTIIATPNCHNINLFNSSLFDSQFTNSYFIELFSSIIMDFLIIQNISLYNSVLIDFDSSTTKLLLQFQFINLQIKNLECQSCYLIYIEKSNETNLTIIINNIELNQINDISNVNINPLFYFFGNSFEMNNCTIELFNNQIYFSIMNFQKVILTNIQAQQRTKNFQLRNSKLFQITTQNLLLINLNLINSYFFNIIPIDIGENNKNINPNFISSIFLKNIYFNNLINLQNSTQSFSTLLAIQYSKQIIINIQNATFNNIWQNSYVQDSQNNYGCIISIQSEYGSIDLKDIYIQNVSTFNSAKSSIYIQAYKITIFQLISQNINDQLDINQSKMFKEYVELQTDYFNILSYGSVLRLSSQYILLYNNTFQSTIGLKGGAIFINTLYSGNIKIYNCLFNQVSAQNSESEEGSGGAIYIQAGNSELNVQIQNISLNNVMSSDIGGFIYINPSMQINNILLNNITCKNVLSRYSKIIYFLSQNSYTNSNINISNLYIFENQNFVQQFYLQLQSKQVYQNTSLLNGMLLIVGNSIKLYNIYYIGGQVNTPFLQINFYKKIQIQTLYISQITIYEGNNLLNINNIQDSLLFSVNILDINLNQIVMNEDISLQFNSLFLLNLTSSQNGIVLINDITFNNNNCSHCIHGLYHQESYVNNVNKIKNILIYNNICGQYGCLNIITKNTTSSISNIFFQNIKGINNQALFGNLFSQYFKIKINQGQFIKNIGEIGGAIYFQQYYQNLTLLNTYFINNTANIGGAIYLNNGNLTKPLHNYFINNIAYLHTNSIVEKPKKIKLQLNNQYFQEISLIQNNTKYDQVNSSYILLFPNQHYFDDYKLFNITTLTFQSLNEKLSLVPFSNFNEALQDQDETYCNLEYYFVSSSSNIESLNQQSTIQFQVQSQSYELNYIELNFDIYQKTNTYIQISTQCTSIEEDYHFIFGFRFLKCQMGEEYYNNYCKVCDSNGGYYCVDPINSQCKRIDTTKINQTNGAMLNLLQHYWRPSIQSDMIEKCISYEQRCLGGWLPDYASCNVGAIGALCEICDVYNIRGDGQYMNSGAEQCSKCGNIIFQIIFFILGLFWNVIITIITMKSISNSNQLFKKLQLTQRSYLTLYKFYQNQMSTLLKMTTNCFQILSCILSFQLQFWPKYLLHFINFTGNQTYLETFQIDCTLVQFINIPTVYLHELLIILLPFLTLALCSSIYALSIVFKRIIYQHSCIRASFIYIFIQNFQLFIDGAISLLVPRTISNINWVQANVSYYYNTYQHKQWIFYFAIPTLIIFCFLIPSLLFYKLNKNKKKLNQIQFRQYYSYIYVEYTSKCYYWEASKFIQKLLIISVLRIFQEYIAIKGVLVAAIIFFYCQTLQKLTPYNQKSLNLYEYQIQKQCGIIIQYGVFLNIVQNNELIIFEQILQPFLYLLGLKLLWLICKKLTYSLIQKFDEKLDPLKKLILTKFPNCINYQSIRSFLYIKKDRTIRVKKRFQVIKQFIKSINLIQKSQLQSQSSNLIDKETRSTTMVLLTGTESIRNIKISSSQLILPTQ